jgi:hypothetical protein
MKDTTPDYESPIKHFALICFGSAIATFGSAFIHISISVVLGILGWLLTIIEHYRFDKRNGRNSFSFSGRTRERKTFTSSKYNKQEMQFTTIGIILMVLSYVSACTASGLGQLN